MIHAHVEVGKNIKNVVGKTVNMNNEELKFDDFIDVKEENSGELENLSDKLNEVSDKVDFDVDNKKDLEKDVNDNNNSKEKDPLISMMKTNLLLIGIVALFIIALAKAYTSISTNKNNFSISIPTFKSGLNKSINNEGNGSSKKRELNYEKLAIVGKPVLIIDEAERIFFVDGRIYDYDINLIKTLTPNRKYTHFNLDGKFVYLDNKGLADEPIKVFTVYDEEFNPVVKNVYSFDMKIDPNVLVVKCATGTRLYTFDLKNYREYPLGYNVTNIKYGNDIFNYVVEYEVNGIKCVDIFDAYFNLRPEISALPTFDKLALIYRTSFEKGGGKRFSGNKDIYEEVRKGYEERAYYAGKMNGNKLGKAYFYDEKTIIVLVTYDNKYQVCNSNLMPLKIFDKEIAIDEDTGRIFTVDGEIYDFDMNLLKKFYHNRKLTHIIINYTIKDEEGFVNPKTRIYYIDDKDNNGNQLRTYNLYDEDFRIILENISSIKVVENKGIEVVKDGKTKMYSFDIWVDIIKGK